MGITQGKRSVAYGVIDLNRGETIEHAKEQINAFVPHKPLSVYFDIVGDEMKHKLHGKYYVNQVSAYIQKKLPYLKEKDILCGFSIEEL